MPSVPWRAAPRCDRFTIARPARTRAKQPHPGAGAFPLVREDVMLYRGSIGVMSVRVMALLAALCLSATGARAFDDAQYPAFNGKWNRQPWPNAPRTPQPPYDPSKGWGEAQQAPLTPEY